MPDPLRATCGCSVSSWARSSPSTAAPTCWPMSSGCANSRSPGPRRRPGPGAEELVRLVVRHRPGGGGRPRRSPLLPPGEPRRGAPPDPRAPRRAGTVASEQPSDSLPAAVTAARQRARRGGGDAPPQARWSSARCSPRTRPRPAGAPSSSAIRRISAAARTNATTRATRARRRWPTTGAGCSRRSTSCGAPPSPQRQADAAGRGPHRDGRVRRDALPTSAAGLPPARRLAARRRRRGQRAAAGTALRAARQLDRRPTATATRSSPPRRHPRGRWRSPAST